MLKKMDRREEDKQKAQALWNKKNADGAAALKEKETARRTEAEKTARLRAMRLAATEQESASKAAAAPAKRHRASRDKNVAVRKSS
jgi:hypothetical protein